jgi:hypothetical protein
MASTCGIYSTLLRMVEYDLNNVLWVGRLAFPNQDPGALGSGFKPEPVPVRHQWARPWLPLPRTNKFLGVNKGAPFVTCSVSPLEGENSFAWSKLFWATLHRRAGVIGARYPCKSIGLDPSVDSISLPSSVASVAVGWS